MKTNSRLSVFALQQKSGRPAAAMVLTVFALIYFLHLLTLLIINMQAGWFTQLESQYGLPVGLYTFEYYFRSNFYIDYGISIGNNVQPATTTQFLIRSEIVFTASLIAIVAALTLAHVKVNRGNDTIRRLSVSHRSVTTIQWLSDCAYTLTVWLSHLVVICLFYILYISLAPAELIYPNNLFRLFARERYLYFLFPVLNPLSLIRMLSLTLAISFLPSLISGIIDSILEKEFIPGMLAPAMISIGLICWSCFSSSHIGSLLLCLSSMLVSAFSWYITVALNDPKKNEE